MRQNEQEIQLEAKFKIRPKTTEGLITKKEDFRIQEAEENSTKILNTQGAEGITEGSENNCVLRNYGTEIFPTMGEMKGK